MRLIGLVMILGLVACSSTPTRREANVASPQREELSPEAMSQVAQSQKPLSSDAVAANAEIKAEELRSEVAKTYSTLRTRDGKALSTQQQASATQHTVSLVDASQRRDYVAMSSSAQNLMSLLQSVNPPRAALVDGLGLAKAIQDVVAASLQANVQEILKAVSAIVAAAMA